MNKAKRPKGEHEDPSLSAEQESALSRAEAKRDKKPTPAKGKPKGKRKGKPA